MIEDRYAVVGGVPKGTRGGFQDLYRSLGQAHVSALGVTRHVLMTIHPERHVRGDWKGELSLRHDAVTWVLRHPATIPLLVNTSKTNANNKSCPTQGVGITVQALAQKAGAQSCGETMAVHPGRKDHRMAGQASMAR
jgi:hypothetical protein